MMILRVYAMWNRSRTILCVLLFIYIVQTISFVTYAGISFNPNTYLSGTSWARLIVTVHLKQIALYFLPPFYLGMISQVQNASFCVFFLNTPPNLTAYFMIPRFVLSVVLLILALMQTLKESVVVYKATKQWQPNQYIRLFAKDGIVYFFTYVNCFLRSLCPSHLPHVLCF
jgi:hypothetical protein